MLEARISTYNLVSNDIMANGQREYIAELLEVVRLRLKRRGENVNGLAVRLTNRGQRLMRKNASPRRFIEGLHYEILDKTPPLTFEDIDYYRIAQSDKTSHSAIY